MSKTVKTRSAALSIAYESISEKVKAADAKQLPLNLGAYFFERLIGSMVVRFAIVNSLQRLCLRDVCRLMGYGDSNPIHTVRRMFLSRGLQLDAHMVYLTVPATRGRKQGYITIQGLRVLCRMVKPERTASIREWIVAQSIGAGNPPETPESLALPLEDRTHASKPTEAAHPAAQAPASVEASSAVQPFRGYARQLVALLSTYCTDAEVLELVKQLEVVKTAVLAGRYAPGLNQAAYDLFAQVINDKGPAA